jgi:ubiquinone/menaquinone biosynthesis C-methylase UbiE
MTMHPRRTTYRASLLRSDYFVVRHLGRFVERALHDRIQPGALVVDVGCGEQPWRQLVEALGGRYLGADVHQNAGGSVALRCAADALPVRAGSADLVLCTEVLEHVGDPAQALAEVRRALRPGGAAIVTTPFLYPLHEEPWDFQRLTRYQLEHSAGRAGLEIVELAIAGNELEVFATLWDRLWSQALPPRPGALRVVLAALARIPANLAAALLSPLLHAVLPRRGYLCNLAVLRAPTDSP